MNLAEILTQAIDGFGKGQIHERNVAERGGDYKFQDLKNALAATKTQEDITHNREADSLEKRQRAAAGRAIEMAMPDTKGLSDEDKIEVYKQRVEQKKQEESLANGASQRALEAAQAGWYKERPQTVQVPVEARTALVLAQAGKAARGPAGPRAKTPEELAAIQALTDDRRMNTAKTAQELKFMGGSLPPGGGVLAPTAAPEAKPVCPEGAMSTSKGRSVRCKGGQWVLNR